MHVVIPQISECPLSQSRQSLVWHLDESTHVPYRTCASDRAGKRPASEMMLAANSFRPRPRQLSNYPHTLSLRVGYWRFLGRLIRKISVFVLDMDDLGIFAALCAQKNLSIVLDTLARFFLFQRQGIQLNDAIASK